MSPHLSWAKAGSWQLPAFKEGSVIGLCSFSHSPSHRLPNCSFVYPARAKRTEDEIDVRGKESSDLTR